MKYLASALLCLLGSLLFAACSRPAEPAATSWAPVAIAELDAAGKAQYARVESARAEMFGELMKTLMAEMNASGPAGAIGVCTEEAPRIAAAISERLELKIGRTSWKLRNPGNAAPAWASGLLDDRPEEPRAAAGPEGQLGVILPIHVAQPCLTCHGAKDSLAPDVLEALATRYPDDQATGYESGDLRGWFWVEVAAASK